MTKYVYIYMGGKSGSTKEEVDTIMGDWKTWFGTLGAHLVDPGNSFGKVQNVDESGESDGSGGPNGYSIVNADSLEDAITWAKDCPVVADGGKVAVCETMPM